LRNWQPPITGLDIMNTFNIVKKEDIGNLKAIVKQAILDGHVEDNKEIAMLFLIKKANEMGIEEKIKI
jgi:uncharacterized membrane protein SpoIIM required for sporulation